MTIVFAQERRKTPDEMRQQDRQYGEAGGGGGGGRGGDRRDDRRGGDRRRRSFARTIITASHVVLAVAVTLVMDLSFLLHTLLHRCSVQCYVTMP